MFRRAFPRDQDFLIARALPRRSPATFPRPVVVRSFGFVTRITRSRLIPAVILIAARPEPPRNARERKPHAVKGKRETVRALLDGGAGLAGRKHVGDSGV